MTTSEFNNQVGPFYLATSGPLLLVHSQLGTHSLRKTFANRIYERLDRDLKKVQRALGPKAITSTVSCLSLREDEIIEAILSI